MSVPTLNLQSSRFGQSLKGQAIWALCSQIVTSSANLICAIFLVRAMGVEDFGRYTVGFLAIMISRNFLNAIVLVPMSSLQPKLKSCTDKAYRLFALEYAGAFSVTSSLFLVLVGSLASFIDGYGWLGIVTYSIALSNLFANMSDFFRRYFFVIGAANTALLVDIVRFSLQAFLTVGFCILLPELLTLPIAFLFISAGGFAGAVVGVVQYGAVRRARQFGIVMWRRHWQLGKWMLPATALEALQGSGPLILFGALMGDAALGLVRAIQQVASLLNLPINTLVQILPSMASRRFVEQGEQALRRFLLQAAILANFLLLVGIIVLVVASELIVEHWMRIETSMTIPLFIAFGVLSIVVLIRQVINCYLYVHERLRLLTLVNLISAISTIALTFLLYRPLDELVVPVGQVLGVILGICFLKSAQSRFFAIRDRAGKIGGER